MERAQRTKIIQMSEENSKNSSGELSSPLGLIAGSGQLPIEFAKNAKAKGLKVIAAAHKDETSPELEQYCETCLWVKVGQVGTVLKFLKKHSVKQVALAGGISRVKLFGGFKLDWRGMALLTRVGSLRDDIILRGVACELEKEGIQVIGASVLLDKSVPKEGLLTKRSPSECELADATLGWEVAKEIGRHEIGQTVVVLDGLVVAVEAVEGTDEAIRRAGELSKKAKGRRKFGGLLSDDSHSPVVVKLCKPQQDTRLDLPTIGIGTIESMKIAGAKALVIEAGKTIILDPDAVIKAADLAGISILSASNLQQLQSGR